MNIVCSHRWGSWGRLVQQGSWQEADQVLSHLVWRGVVKHDSGNQIQLGGLRQLTLQLHGTCPRQAQSIADDFSSMCVPPHVDIYGERHSLTWHRLPRFGQVCLSVTRQAAARVTVYYVPAHQIWHVGWMAICKLVACDKWQALRHMLTSVQLHMYSRWVVIDWQESPLRARPQLATACTSLPPHPKP